MFNHANSIFYLGGIMKYDKKIVLVYGFKKSGQSAAKFLSERGALVYAYDDKESFIENATVIKNLSLLSGKNLDFVVLSPGVDINSPKIQELLLSGVKIKSELELGAENLKAKLFTITGTNGKTTCVNLLYNIFKQAGKETELFGNVGTPITSIVDNLKRTAYGVCEVSSFQMETTENLKSFASALLNITPDHLDRHKTMENYINLKLKLLEQAKHKVFNADDEISYNLSKRFNKAVLFSKNRATNGAYVKGEFIYYKNSKVMKTELVTLRGEKNLENVLAVITLAKLGCIKNADIIKGITSFKPLEHRLELVDIVDDVSFVDDSKSTNVASTLNAISAFTGKNIILLLGGRGKELDFAPIFENKLYAAVCFGECGLDILKVARAERVAYEENLKAAFNKAYELARPGSVVLLSPACASFDEFTSYKQRGDYFKRLVRSVKMGER